MNLHLKRLKYLPAGIFGNLQGDGLNLYTLEHSYNENDAWTPKVPQGIYTCKRGIHRLENRDPFETFEVINVPGHTGILFHRGNTQSDSMGCILLGLEVDLTENRLLESAVAFEKFMAAQDDDGFQLTVEN